MWVYTVYVTLCNHDPGAQGKSSMVVPGWRTRVYVEDFTGYLLLLLVLAYYISLLFGDPIFLSENGSLELLKGQSTRIWHVQIPVMAKIQPNIAKM